MKIFETIEQLQAMAGQEIGASDWLEISQDRIQAFAEATGDHQWIHLDEERAKQESPWGTTIAHGYLTLSLLPQLNQQIMQLQGVKASINYGLDKLRFPTPVPSGSRVRSRLALTSLKAQTPERYLAKYTTTIEIDGSEKPACVAENLVVYLV